MARGAWRIMAHGITELDTTERLSMHECIKTYCSEKNIPFKLFHSLTMSLATQEL